jgi:FkbM family methyltransferase
MHVDRPAHFRNLFGFGDELRYLAWRVLRSPGVFHGRLKDGTMIRMRSLDYGTAYEVFFAESYRLAVRPSSVTRIVDVGGNVGYSCLYWAKHFPDARIETFEPHPVHCRMLTEQLKENRLLDRVRLHPAAATSKNGQAHLRDSAETSTVLKAPQDGALPIETVDFFETVGSDPIDIIKLDIEGGEYELLADERFERLAPRIAHLTMEYHERSAADLGGAWCEQRLQHLGFATTRQQSNSYLGMIRAHRPEHTAES